MWSTAPIASTTCCSTPAPTGGRRDRDDRLRPWILHGRLPAGPSHVAGAVASRTRHALRGRRRNRKDELIYQAGILDIAPTILTLFGLPSGADMEGRPLRAAFEHPVGDERMASWDDIIARSTRSDESGQASANDAAASVDNDAFAELAAFGYDDALTPLQHFFQQMLQQVEQFHLAIVHRSAGRMRRAVEILEAVLEAGGGQNVVARLYLAASHYQLQQYDRCRDLLAAISDDDELFTEKELLLALVMIAERRPDEALARLKIAAGTRQREPQLFCVIGRAYGQLERYRRGGTGVCGGDRH